MREIHNQATQSKMRARVIDCDNCAHCIDLNVPNDITDAPDLKKARSEVASQMLLWLEQARLAYKSSQTEVTFLQ